MSDFRKYGNYYNNYSKSGQHRRHQSVDSSDQTARTRARSTQRTRYSRRRPRDEQQPSRCIGIFGLSTLTTEDKLLHLFSVFGPIERIKMVNFFRTYVSRGFCFIYFESLRDAQMAKNQSTGMKVDGRPIRVVYSITEEPHPSTPGVYMGRTSRRSRSRSRKRNIGSRSRSNSIRRNKHHSLSQRK